MSVRAVAIRGTKSARLRVLPRTLSAPAAETTWRPRLSLMARLLDDHDLVNVKLVLVTLLLIVAMALEVPW
ncbi:MAG: hypothetical protein AUH31_06485 [Armatimonadetes bacterium 13_1_40CM_64_14]|nr:MAG: hypothetical protein AUH31_06485 [Armatimonadetes bacterium 13_1_40CM_64_14]